MAKLLSGTRVYGIANVDNILTVGNITPVNSTSNTTGSLIVVGGVGILGNTYTGNLVISGSSAAGNGITFADGTRQTTAATGGSGTIDQWVRDTANVIIGVDTSQNTRMTIIEGVNTGQNTRMTIIEGVDTTQNTNITTANNAAWAAYAAGNTNATNITSVNTYAGSAYAQANATAGGLVTANTNITTANNAAQAAFTLANTHTGQITIIQGVDTTQNTNITTANNAAWAAYAAGNTNATNITAVNTYAGSAYAQANATAGGLVTANTNITTANNAAQAAFTLANTHTGQITVIQGVDTGQNTRMTIIEGVDTTQNTNITTANNAAWAAYAAGNTSAAAITIIQGVDTGQNTRMTIIEGVNTGQNTRMTIIEGVDTGQNTTITAVNTFAQSAYNKANTGGTFSGDVTVTGNLIVNGITTTVNTSTITTSDSLIKLANNNTAGDSIDIGFYGTYNSSGQKYSGLVRQAGSNFFLFKDITTDPTANTLPAGSLTGANTGTLNANITGYITSNGYELLGYSSAAYALANTHTSQITIIQGVDTGQNTRMTIIEGVDTGQNTNITTANNAAQAAFTLANTHTGQITIIQGVDTGQNTRMTIIEGVDTGQNTRMTIIEGVDTGQNTTITAVNNFANGAFVTANSAQANTIIIQGVDTGQNTRMTIIEGVDTTQNTNITAVNTYAGSAYAKANTAVTSVTGTAPVVSSGGTTPAISMAAATTSANGYLTSTDWNTFNNKGSGTVTSVAQTFTGGLISVAGSPITTSGTLALTVAGTSGGIPYFSSASAWASSAALAANALVIGGGAGTAPATTTTGTGVVTALGVNTGTAGAFVVNGGALGTPASGVATNLTGTASININGTVGATTVNTGAFTTLSMTSSLKLTGTTYGAGTDAWIGPNSSASSWFQNVPTGGTHSWGFANAVAPSGMTLTGTGLGIGTNSPVAQLDIYNATNGYGGIGLQGYSSATKWYLSSGISGVDVSTFSISNSVTGVSPSLAIKNTGNVGIGTATPGYKLEVNGSFAATTKSFVIPHPTKEGKKLRYGSLEGPENGVYIRGKLTNNNTIELPEYWTKLVDQNSITVQLTPIGKHQKLFVEDIVDNTVIIGNENILDKNINCFYVVFAERIDVEKLEVEVE